MSSDPTRDLIHDLASDLTPVKPLPRVRFVAAAVLLLWLVIGAIAVVAKGIGPSFAATFGVPVGTTGVFAGLLVAGVGGALAAIALAIPGRERLARGALVLGTAGLAVAGGIGLVLLARSPLVEWRLFDLRDALCLLTALAVGLLPALALAWFGGRAAPLRPLVIALAAGAGAAALGGSIAQATCWVVDAVHLILGHVIVPAVGAFVLTLPLLIAIRRSEQQQNR